MSGPDAEIDAARIARARFKAGIVRFCVTFVVILAAQLGIEMLIFGKIGPDEAFQKELVSALKTFDPTGLGKLWLEVGLPGKYSEPLEDTPEYKVCMQRRPSAEFCRKAFEDAKPALPGNHSGPVEAAPYYKACMQRSPSAESCRKEAQEKRDQAQVDPHSWLSWGPLRLAANTWNVAAHQFRRDQTPAFRLIAFAQLLLGYAVMLGVSAYLLRFPRFANMHPFWAFVLFLVGGIGASVLVAFPMRWLALHIVQFATALYGAAGFAVLSQIVNGIMGKILDRLAEAPWQR
jgi:hypothetical protein